METTTCPATDQWEEKVRGVALEIEHYLKTHPQAVDSLEGIATWWVLRQRIHAELVLVRAALSQLVAAGVVATEPQASHQEPVYRLNKGSQEWIPAKNMPE